MEEAEQEKKMQTTESGHGNSFYLDVIGKSCSITLNVEHGRSSGCWRYLVCLKPSLPSLPQTESSQEQFHQTLFHVSPRKISEKILRVTTTLSQTNIVIDLSEATGRFLEPVRLAGSYRCWFMKKYCWLVCVREKYYSAWKIYDHLRQATAKPTDYCIKNSMISLTIINYKVTMLAIQY